MLPSVIFIAVGAASASTPTCSVSGRMIANKIQELPISVRKALAHWIAGRGQPFKISDAIPAGQEHRPFMRLLDT